MISQGNWSARWIALSILVSLCGCARAQKEEVKPDEDSAIDFRVKLRDFEISPYWGEQIKRFVYDPDVKIHVNAPSVESFDARKPTQIIFFALPNGNSTEQTIGKVVKEGVDWHFGIQHIGAQTRRLREVMTDKNIVVVYVEASSKSWPNWRSTHKDANKLIAELVPNIVQQFKPLRCRVSLACHSGGGSFVIGFLNGSDEIPQWVERLVFIDADYSYSDKEGHGDKLVKWLNQRDTHYLCVICYDDRDVILNGKNIVDPDGGTWRATLRMIERMKKDIPLDEKDNATMTRYTGLDGRVEFRMMKNPDLKILHTELVEKNGFIHGMTFATPDEKRAGEFWAERAYDQWIQPE
ncbi:MAG: hypothetical protein V2A74_09970 [bacterium]